MKNSNPNEIVVVDALGDDPLRVHNGIKDLATRLPSKYQASTCLKSVKCDNCLQKSINSKKTS